MSPDDAYLLDMQLASREVLSFVEGVSWEQFAEDRVLQLAVLHALQTVGEAARQVSAKTQSGHPEIPWQLIIGMRHRLVHDYGRVNLRIVWTTIQRDVPALIAALDFLSSPDETDR